MVNLPDLFVFYVQLLLQSMPTPSSWLQLFHLISLSLERPSPVLASSISISSNLRLACQANLKVSSGAVIASPSDNRRLVASVSELGHLFVRKLKCLKLWWAWSNTSWAFANHCNSMDSLHIWPIQRTLLACHVSPLVVLYVIFLALTPRWRVLTGYVSGSSFSLWSQTYQVCSQSRTTFVGLTSDLFRWSLRTGYFSCVSLLAVEAEPVFGVSSVGSYVAQSKQNFRERPCSNLPSFVGVTYERVLVSTSQCMVTTSSPVDDFVLNSFPFTGVLVIVRFDTPPGPYQASPSLCLYLCLVFVQTALIFYSAIWVCLNVLIYLVSF